MLAVRAFAGSSPNESRNSNADGQGKQDHVYLALHCFLRLELNLYSA